MNQGQPLDGTQLALTRDQQAGAAVVLAKPWNKEVPFMALIRFTPNRELLSMQDEVNRLFDSVMGRSARPDGNAWLPPVDIQETDDGFTVRMDLPGVQPKDVKINMTGNTLSVRGERRCERDENNPAWQRTECA